MRHFHFTLFYGGAVDHRHIYAKTFTEARRRIDRIMRAMDCELESYSVTSEKAVRYDQTAFVGRMAK